jgi:SAM-dependent methyltransferase
MVNQWDNFYAGKHTQHFPSEQVIRLLRRIYPVGNNPTDKLVLDMGCGNGRNLPILRHVFAGYDNIIIGLDISPAALDSSGYSNRIIKDAAETGMPSESYDFILDDGCSHHCEKPGDVFREMARILKQGGHAIIGFMAQGSVWHGNASQLMATPICQNIPTSGPETGIPQNYMTPFVRPVKSYFADFGLKVIHFEKMTRESVEFTFVFNWIIIQKA